MSCSVIAVSNLGSVYGSELGYKYIDSYDAIKLPLATSIKYIPYDKDKDRCLLPEAGKLSDGLDRLIEKDGKALPPAKLKSMAKQSNIRYDNEKVRVIIHLSEEDFDFKTGSTATIDNVKFDLERKAGKQLQALVAVDDLIGLAKSNDVIAITAPQLPDFYAVTSEGVNIIEADKLHNSGIKGQDVTIGILDGGFYGYTSLLGTELPSTLTTKSFHPAGIGGGGINHGTAVAEIVHDIAPDASLVLVNFETDFDFLDAVDWLIAQDVDVITTSTGFTTTGPIDGTDAIARKANQARNAGIIFDAAAGNYGNKHHYKQFTPSSIPEFHDFGTGYIGLLEAETTPCTPITAGTLISIDMVWDDWGADPDTPTSSEDYDLYLFRYDGYNLIWPEVALSENWQNGNAFPRESISVTAPETDCYGIVVVDYNTSSSHYLSIFSDNIPFSTDIQTPERSLITPCVGENVLCIGATDLSDNIKYYSSQGPTIPNEITHIELDKPDLTAPAGVSTATKGTLGFGGTSAAAPHVGGAAALYLQMADMDPSEAESQLIADALDLGILGWDSVYGHGRLRLYGPPPGHLEPYLIDPLSDKNAVQNEFFEFSSGVKCVGGECGDVSAALAEKEIYYDDGSTESGWVWHYDGNMYAVRFTPIEYPVKLKKAIFYIRPDYPGNDNFNIAVFDDDGIGGAPGTLLGSTNSGIISSGWVEVDISSLDISITDGDFYIAFVQVGSVSMGADKNGPWAQRSWKRYVTGGWEWEQFDSSDGNLMIRATVSIISTTIGDTPFYTIDENPATCYGMSDGENCNTLWRVNPTGNVGKQYEFFTLYESDNANLEKKETEKVTITIMPGGKSFNISLKQGWNLISTPLNFTNLTKTFETIKPYFDSMFAYDAEYQKFIKINPFIDQEVDLKHGVWIKVNDDVTLTITGKEFENKDIPLVQGWNLVGYTYLEPKDITELYNNDIVYSYNQIWSSYIPGRTFNSLQTLKPGYGYWVNKK